jgi:hypothetical protein
VDVDVRVIVDGLVHVHVHVYVYVYVYVYVHVHERSMDARSSFQEAS